MNLYVLDTDTLTLFQEGHPKVRERAGAVPAAEIAISVISVEEQLSGWYAQLRQAKRPDRLAWAYRRLISFDFSGAESRCSWGQSGHWRDAVIVGSRK